MVGFSDLARFSEEQKGHRVRLTKAHWELFESLSISVLDRVACPPFGNGNPGSRLAPLLVSRRGGEHSSDKACSALHRAVTQSTGLGGLLLGTASEKPGMHATEPV